jgi:hypothetical protein
MYTKLKLETARDKTKVQIKVEEIMQYKDIYFTSINDIQ